MKVDEYLHKVMLRIDPELFGIICGSYRRHAKVSGDIDVLLVHPSYTSKAMPDEPPVNYLGEFIDELKSDNFIVDSLTGDEVKTKYMGYCKYDGDPVRRIDIRFIPYDSYYTAILYFTGPKDFNKRMRLLAISLGYHLSEYSLVEEEGNRPVPINSEKDVFDALGMEYLPPEKRK
ncbi:MAG: DNA polymerase family X protein [Harvfovirus sp.]|uniref:DNA polymerase family X protein n=1 Tax=Harvfovirus sp. TaxID=2487768 RepID=A0A3G5A1Z9_9VIRU|nr:MAG: DNA polymerase family X protein [Harvfovirus sp.]